MSLYYYWNGGVQCRVKHVGDTVHSAGCGEESRAYRSVFLHQKRAGKSIAARIETFNGGIVYHRIRISTMV